MKNTQRGFIVPVLITIIALLIIGNGVYFYENKKEKNTVITDAKVQQSDLKSIPTTPQKSDFKSIPTIPQNSTVIKPSMNTPVIQQNEKIQVYVNVVDKNGQPFKATRVWWYYPPVNGAQATEYPATCVNNTCTRWSVTGAIGPRVYTAADYTIRPTPGALCFTHAYDAKPVDLSSSITEVTLTLEPGSYCY